jgi:hypothetical protein
VKRYWPSASVTEVRSPIIDGLVMVMVTPGITAPVPSVTRPLIAPVPDVVACAMAVDADTSTKNTETTHPTTCCMEPPFKTGQPTRGELPFRYTKRAR